MQHRDHGEARLAQPLQLVAPQSVSCVSWSAAKADKLASCSTTSSDISVWSAVSGRCELTLHAGNRTAAGRVGLLALQTLKVRCMLQCSKLNALIGHHHKLEIKQAGPTAIESGCGATTIKPRMRSVLSSQRKHSRLHY